MDSNESKRNPTIIVALIALASAVLVALITNIDKLSSIFSGSSTKDSVAVQHVSTAGGQQDNIGISKDKIKNVITEYYIFLYKNDYTSLQSFYADKVDKFYSKLNLSRADVINQLQQDRATEGILGETNNIHWDHSSMTRNADGTYSVVYNMDYNINRVENNKPKHFNLDAIVTLTSTYKISSINENILSKN